MNKIYFLLLAFISFSTTLFAQEGKDISVNDFYKNISASNIDFQLVDVRTPGEFNSGHLKNADNIDYNDRRFLTEINTLDKTKPTYIYCRSGGRSAGAMKDMLALGFTEVYNMTGGIKAWNGAKLPTTASLSSLSGMTMEEFEKLTNQDIPVLIDFTATWCGPCKMMKPSLVKLGDTYPEKIKVIYIDVDQNKELVNEIGIRAMPTLHLYKKGKRIKEKVGLISYEELKRFIR